MKSTVTQIMFFVRMTRGQGDECYPRLSSISLFSNTILKSDKKKQAHGFPFAISNTSNWQHWSRAAQVVNHFLLKKTEEIMDNKAFWRGW